MSQKLFIISGHGAGDSGAVGNGYQEAECVRALATEIKKYGGDNVILADFNINSYKSNIIGKGLVPKGSLILELHLDSHKNTNAKGGHVIINGNFKQFSGYIPRRQNNGNLLSGTPTNKYDVANKEYVDALKAEIDELRAMIEELKTQ